jgi:hypothetical protein
MKSEKQSTANGTWRGKGMQVKYIVIGYVQHWGHEPVVRAEKEFLQEPTYAEIKQLLDTIELYKSDYEIDYSTGAVLPDYRMPRKSKVQRIFAVVEKRYYREEMEK